MLSDYPYVSSSPQPSLYHYSTSAIVPMIVDVLTETLDTIAESCHHKKAYKLKGVYYVNVSRDLLNRSDGNVFFL